MAEAPQEVNQPKTYSTEMSDNIGSLAAALAKAQGAMTPALKDAANPFFKSKYADLSSVWEAARKPLSTNELAVIQTTNGDSEVVTVITTLIHSSGQWVRGTLKMRPVKNDPQGIGSCLTYARRYALSAIVGICPDDDDGEAATRREKPEGKELITKDQASILSSLCDEVGMPKDEFCKVCKVKSIPELAAARFEGAKAYIKNYKKPEKKAEAA